MPTMGYNKKMRPPGRIYFFLVAPVEQTPKLFPLPDNYRGGSTSISGLRYNISQYIIFENI